jgi:hypothetical protein
VVAARRVEAAICAFGGYLQPKQSSTSQAMSIFRLNGHQKSAARDYYEQHFHQRYFVSAYHVSWEVEEDPPVALEVEDQFTLGHRHGASEHGSPRNKRAFGGAPAHASPQDCNIASSDSVSSSTGSIVLSENQQKMKYRYVYTQKKIPFHGIILAQV